MSSDSPLRQSKIFRADAQNLEVWKGDAIRSNSQETLNSKLVLLQQQAYQKGFELGQKEGHQAGFAQGLQQGEAQAKANFSQERAALLAELSERLQVFEQPFRLLNEEVKEALARVVAQVTHQVLKSKIQLEPQLLSSLLQTALDYLPQGHQQVTIRLNAQDLAFFTQHSLIDQKTYRWLADARLETGDCVIESEHTQIDATLETQIATALSGLLSPKE